MAGSLGELVVKISTDLTSFNQGLKDAKDKLNSTRGEILKLTDTTGKNLLKFGAVISGALALTVKAASDFEDAFNGVKATINLSDKEFKKLEDNIKGISKEFPIAASELAKLTEQVAQLGVRGVDNLTNFVKVSALFAKTTGLGAEQAATSLNKFINTIGASQSKVGNIASSIMEVADSVGATEESILSFSTTLGAAGKQIGLSEEQVIGFAGAMLHAGVNAETGAVAFQKVAFEMQQAVSTGSKELSTFAQVAGLSSSEFSRLFKEDAAGAITLFFEGLKREGDNAIPILESLKLSGRGVATELLKMANASGEFKDAIALAGDASSKNTALTDEAAERFKTFSSQLSILKNNLTLLGIEIGSVLLPSLVSLVDKIKPVVDNVSVWIGENPALFNQIVQIVAIIGSLSIALGTLMGILKPLIILFSTPVVGAIAAATVAIVAFDLALKGLVESEWFLKVVDWAIDIKKKFEDLRNFLVDKFASAFGTLKEPVKTFFQSLFEGLDTIYDKAERTLGTLVKISTWGMVDLNKVKGKAVERDIYGDTVTAPETTGTVGIGTFSPTDVLGVQPSGVGPVGVGGALQEGGLQPVAQNVFGVGTTEEEIAATKELLAVTREEELLETENHLMNLDSLEQNYSDIRKNRATTENKSLLDNISEYFGLKQKLSTDELKKTDAYYKESENLAKTTFSNQIGFFRSYLSEKAQENKAYAVANKAVGIIEGIVNTALGITAALRTANVPLAIAIGILGAAQVGIMASQSFAVGTDFVPEDMLANIHKGEAIIPARENQFLQSGELALVSPRASNSFGGTVNVTINEAAISNSFDLEDLSKMLGEQIKMEMMRA